MACVAYLQLPWPGHPLPYSEPSSTTTGQSWPRPMPMPRGKPVAQSGSIPWSLPGILRTVLEASRAQVPECPQYIKTGHPRTNPLATVPQSPRALTQGFFPVWGYSDPFSIMLSLYHGLYLFSHTWHLSILPLVSFLPTGQQINS